MEIYKEQLSNSQRLQEDDKKKFEQEISEMCATLEKYKVFSDEQASF